jgi:hypothetical protein
MMVGGSGHCVVITDSSGHILGYQCLSGNAPGDVTCNF